MTVYRFWNWDVLDSKASVDIAMDYMSKESEKHERYVENMSEIEVVDQELYSDILEGQRVQSVDRYIFGEEEVDVVEVGPGIYLMGSDDHAERTEKILRSESPSGARRKIERRNKIENVKSMLEP